MPNSDARDVEVPETLIYGPGAVNPDGSVRMMDATEESTASKVAGFADSLNPLNKVTGDFEYIINAVAVFFLATVALSLGIFFIFSKQIMGLIGGGKVGTVANIVGEVAGGKK